MELELWTREAADLQPLLPRADAWEDDGGELHFEGDGWLVTVFPPEEDDEVPADLSSLVDGLRYWVLVTVEPGDPGPEAQAFVHEILDAVGGRLGGAAVDPDSGRSSVWPP